MYMYQYIMCISIHLYVYISIYLSLSLSLYIYIYIHTHIYYIEGVPTRTAHLRSAPGETLIDPRRVQGQTIHPPLPDTTSLLCRLLTMGAPKETVAWALLLAGKSGTASVCGSVSLAPWLCLFLVGEWHGARLPQRRAQSGEERSGRGKDNNSR